MKSIHSIVTAVVLAVLLFGAAAGIEAGDRDKKPRREHELVREALRRGEVLPLAQVLAIATGRVPGEIIEVELEAEKQGRLVYELKVLTRTGRVREIEIDARTGDVLKIEDD